MKLSRYIHPIQLHADIVGQALATNTFLVGAHGVTDIEATPFGVIVSLAETDLLFPTGGGYGILRDRRNANGRTETKAKK